MLMFTDIDLDGDMSGLELAAIAKQHYPDIDIIVTSGQNIEDIPEDVLFMQKPWLPLELLRQAEMSRQRHTLH